MTTTKPIFLVHLQSPWTSYLGFWRNVQFPGLIKIHTIYAFSTSVILESKKNLKKISPPVLRNHDFCQYYRLAFHSNSKDLWFQSPCLFFHTACVVYINTCNITCYMMRYSHSISRGQNSKPLFPSPGSLLSQLIVGYPAQLPWNTVSGKKTHFHGSLIFLQPKPNSGFALLASFPGALIFFLCQGFINLCSSFGCLFLLIWE